MSDRASTDMILSVTVLGLGVMGRPIARTLSRAGLRVSGWNRSQLPARLVDGISLRTAVTDAALDDAQILMLEDSAAVDEVLTQLTPRLESGQIVVDMGSSEPWESEAHARSLAERGIGWVDAPVSGGPEGAEAGSLAVMAGGAIRDFERVRPLLEVLGDNVVRVGEAGAGHTAKLSNQVIVGVLVEAVAEALTLAERAGLDPDLTREAMRGGSADTRPLHAHGRRMIARDYEPRARVTTMLKDLRTASELARRLDLELPCTERVVALAQQLVERGEGELDIAALHRLRTA